MSDANATPSEPEAANSSKQNDTSQSNGTSSAPTKFSWADDVETPVVEKAQEKKDDSASKSEAKGTSLEENQKDGATTWMMGSELDEPEFDVNVTLADLQDDPNNPLYSAKTFQELNL